MLPQRLVAHERSEVAAGHDVATNELVRRDPWLAIAKTWAGGVI